MNINLKYRIVVLILSTIFYKNLISQNNIVRNPDSRKDYVNVFYNSQYTLFDFLSDEPIFPNTDGIYTIYTATNEDKTPRLLTGNSSIIASSITYKFKNYSNCKSWCDGKIYVNDKTIGDVDTSVIKRVSDVYDKEMRQ